MLRTLTVRLLFYVVVTPAVAVACELFAQTDVQSASDGVASVASLQHQLQLLEADTQLAPESKSVVRELLRQTISDIQTAERAERDAESFRGQAESASKDAARIRREIELLRASRPLPIPDELRVDELRERLASCESRLAEARTAFQEAEDEPNRRSVRRRKISMLVGELQQSVVASEQQLATANPRDESPAVTAARRNYLTSHIDAHQRQIEALQSERNAYDITVDLLPLRRRLAELVVNQTEHEVARIRQAIAERSRRDVTRQLQESRQALAVAADTERPVATEVVELAEQRAVIRRQCELARQRHDRVRNELAELRLQQKRTRKLVQETGLTNAIGQLLRRHRVELLPDEKRLRRELADRQSEIQSLQQKIFELEERQHEIGARNGSVRADRDLQPEMRTPAGETLREEYLQLLITDAHAYFYQLVDLDQTVRECLAESQSYGRFIDENALWIRGTEFFHTKDLRYASDALVSLCSLEPWRGVSRALARDARARPILTLSTGLLFLLLVYGSRRASRSVARLGERAMRSTTQQIAPTLATFGLTVFSVLAWPALMAYAGWRLGAVATSRGFDSALAEALWQTSIPFFLLLLARQTCRSKGLAGAHFGWTTTDLAQLRRWLRWLMLLVLPLVFIVTFFNALDNVLWRYSLGRAMLSLLGLITAVFAHKLLRPVHGVLYHVSGPARGGWLHRFRHPLHLIAVGTPLVVAVLAALGYYLAALRLAECLLMSVMLLFGVLLFGSLLFRWVLVSRRWLAIQQARERRSLQRSSTLDPAGSVPALAAMTPGPLATTLAPPRDRVEDPRAVGAAPQIDLAAITTQTRRFLGTSMAVLALAGLWYIWIDVVPALRILDRVELWHRSVQITQSIESDGSIVARQVPRVEAVTAADCLLVAVLIAVTVLAGRNLPGMLELGLWQRLNIDAGARFALTATTRYAIYIVGLLIVANRLGFAWSKVGWLVAALTVGLGFGLQEIFANFVSGLIVLAERPVRVGDLITIGKINGTVTKIQMRATTIRDWNYRELIVPNKKLVTENLINWTLSDSNYRVDLVLRIAYGSDTEKARAILLEIAARHPRILDKPKPKAIFRAFGPSALEIEYRIYIPHMDFWPRVVTDVNTAIAREFRQAGIEIALPQQDIHIRTISTPLPSVPGPSPSVEDGDGKNSQPAWVLAGQADS